MWLSENTYVSANILNGLLVGFWTYEEEDEDGYEFDNYIFSFIFFYVRFQVW